MGNRDRIPDDRERKGQDAQQKSRGAAFVLCISAAALMPDDGKRRANAGHRDVFGRSPDHPAGSRDAVAGGAWLQQSAARAPAIGAALSYFWEDR